MLEDTAIIPGDVAANLPVLTPKSMLALMVRTLGGVVARAQFVTFSAQPEGRTPFDLIARRYGKAAADLSLAILRLSQGITEGRFESDAWLAAPPDLRIALPSPSLVENDLRMAAALGAAAADDLRIPVSGGKWVDFDLRMTTEPVPTGRRRGGQPGNSNRRIHGRRSRLTVAANRYDHDLLHQARTLCKVVTAVHERLDFSRTATAGRGSR